MTRQKKGAAIRQDTRANTQPARSRKARPSVAELEERDAWSIGKTAAIIAIGAVFLYAFMWLAAAY